MFTQIWEIANQQYMLELQRNIFIQHIALAVLTLTACFLIYCWGKNVDFGMTMNMIISLSAGSLLALSTITAIYSTYIVWMMGHNPKYYTLIIIRDFFIPPVW